MEKSYYEILGVPSHASYLEIKQAYRKLAKEHHPDRLNNPTEDQQVRFAKIAEAHSVLSNLQKRKAYDDRLRQNAAPPPGPGPQPYPFTQPHYSGYPYFQWDFITPFLHSIFIPPSPRRLNKKEAVLKILFNHRTILAAILGALLFFNFFTAMDGRVVEKDMEAGLFQSVSYNLVLKKDSGDIQKRRVKSKVYDAVKINDRISKSYFSFSYKINNVESFKVSPKRFLLQVFLIYAIISIGLLALEYGRK